MFFDKKKWSLLFLCIITLTLYGTLFVSHRALNKSLNELKDENLNKEIWFVRFLIQNGLAFYATWVSIATVLNFVVYITWRLGAYNTNASTAGLCLVLAAALGYSIVENIVWPHYLLYTFSPWIVIIVAFVGIITKHWVNDNPSRNNILSLVILVVAGLLVLLKILAFVLYKSILKQRIRNLIA
jgi:hypothetical protein